jgi:hypothetical protein
MLENICWFVQEIVFELRIIDIDIKKRQSNTSIIYTECNKYMRKKEIDGRRAATFLLHPQLTPKPNSTKSATFMTTMIPHIKTAIIAVNQWLRILIRSPLLADIVMYLSRQVK